jgi:hypothetical protein
MPPEVIVRGDLDEARAAALVPDSLDLLETAWGIIANAGGGDWTRETPDWQDAAARWRDRYHATLVPDSLDALRLRRIEEAAWDVVRRTGGLTVHFTGGMPYLVVKPDWTDALAAALREGRTP